MATSGMILPKMPTHKSTKNSLNGRDSLLNIDILKIYDCAYYDSRLKVYRTWLQMYIFKL